MRKRRKNNIFSKGNESTRRTKGSSVQKESLIPSSTERETLGFSSRGQSPLLSHTIMLAFSLLMIIVVISMLSSLRDNYSDFVGKKEIAEVCLMLRDGVGKILVDDSYVSPTNTTKGKSVMRLPDRIADQNYRARFANSSLFIETLSQPRINDTCKLGYNATYTGFTSGGITEINYTLRDDATKIIAMKKV